MNNATNAFAAHIADMTAMLERLQQAAQNHLGLTPDEINWSHVGSAGHYAAQLREICDQVFQEGEFAKAA